MTDYKNYSLEQLKNFLYDAMGAAEASPQEIYDVIKGVVEDNYHTYKHQTSQAYELLALLNGNGKGHITMYDDTELMPHLQCDGNDTSFQVSEKSEHFYDYDRNDINKKNPFVDKVKKWVLPVEADGPSGEYFITFPDDLLEAANLKEGDQIEWHDQGDGSYLLKKFEKKANTYDEMIAAGYTMTDDGFWIKETK
jgi:antitoxin component of MazEF toxin-antitoxin module